MINNLINYFFDNIFNDCLVCEKEANQSNYLCEDCIKDLSYFNTCFACNMNETCCCKFKSFIPLRYEQTIKNLILRFKYSEKFYLSDFFAQMIYEYTDIRKHCDSNTIFVPIPISKKRLFKRTYNQSVLLCKSLNKYFSGDIGYFVLKKTKNIHQYGDKNQRFLNKTSIELDDFSQIINKNICIIDDVIASGSTINRCIDLLYPYAKSINIAVVAKV